MGYTTNFSGQFKFDKELPAECALKIIDLHENDSDAQPKEAPRGYCQWELTRKRDGIQWDSGEKFYDYVEWLEYIIEYILKPAGIALTGSVEYSGEDVTDCGVITVENGVVKKIKKMLVTEDTAELIAFRDFVLAHRDCGPIVAAWKRLQQQKHRAK